MRAVSLVQPARLELINVDAPPPPAPDEVQVRVRRIGVCGTDLHAFQGHQPFFNYPRILGHELAVEVLKTGEAVSGHAPGDMRVPLPYLACGKCPMCAAGRTNACVKLRVLGVHIDGGMCELLNLPQQFLMRADGLNVDQMGLVENQAIGAHAVRRAAMSAGETVLVIGAGPIGLGAIQFARIAGARVAVLDVSATRLKFAMEVTRAHIGIDATTATVETVREACGALPTVVFDCTGNLNAMNRSFDYVASGGRLVLVSVVQGRVNFDDPEFHRRELTVMSSRNATRADFEHVMSCMMNGSCVTQPLITHRAKLEHVPAHFASWVDPSSAVIKAMIEL